jgi:hypothetical protein
LVLAAHVPGWADVYVADDDCQWLDITDVLDGTYTLYVGADDSDVVDEEGSEPNAATVTVKLQGDTWQVVR